LTGIIAVLVLDIRFTAGAAPVVPLLNGILIVPRIYETAPVRMDNCNRRAEVSVLLTKMLSTIEPLTPPVYNVTNVLVVAGSI
jgi:hypothetical protein